MFNLINFILNNLRGFMEKYFRLIGLCALCVSVTNLSSKSVSFTVKGPVLQGKGQFRAFAVPYSSVAITEMEGQKRYVKDITDSDSELKLTFDDAFVRSIEMDRVWVGEDKFKHGASSLNPYVSETSCQGLFALKSIPEDGVLYLDVNNHKIVKKQQ